MHTIEELENKFGGASRLVNSALRGIRSLSTMRPNNCGDLENFVQTIQVYFERLKDARQEGETKSYSLYVDLLACMPEVYQLDYDDWLERQQRNECSRALLDWARKKLSSLQKVAERSRENKVANSSERGTKGVGSRAYVCNNNMDDVQNSEPEQLPVESSFAMFVRAKSGVQIDGCIFCPKKTRGEHRSVDCAEFTLLSVQARRNLVSALNMCFICGTTTHIARNCRAETCNM